METWTSADRIHVTTAAHAHLQFTVPAGLEHFHVEMGEPAHSLTIPPPTPPDIEKMQALAAKYHFDIVGPPLSHE